MQGAHIVLVGMPAAGKSAVGGQLAQRLGLPLVDLDDVIALDARATVGALLRHEGEAAFRVREAAALQAALHGPQAVVATGGGAAIFHGGWQHMRDSGHVVWIDVPLDTLSERVLTDPTERPLLGDTRQAVLANLLQLEQARTPIYAKAHVRVDGSAAPAQVAAAIARALQPPVMIAAPVNDRPSQVVVHDGELGAAAEALADLAAGARIALVVDRAVADHAAPLAKMLAARNLAPAWIDVPGGEKGKTTRGLAQLWGELADHSIGRNDLLVAVGGGATIDLAGFAAATWQRGMRTALLPTTVLAMADASVGGKTAIDVAQGKNLVGAFHAPELVWCALESLATLPVRHFRAGLAEIAKIFLLFDAKAWQQLLADAPALRRRDRAALRPHLQAAIRWKAQVVLADPHETAAMSAPLHRSLLNLGHTIGHACEAASNYATLHGEAVALGLCAEATWAEAHGHASLGTADAVIAGLAALGLNTQWQRAVTPEVLQRTCTDKKMQGGQLHLPTLRAVGDAVMQDVVADVWRAQMVTLVPAPLTNAAQAWRMA